MRILLAAIAGFIISWLFSSILASAISLPASQVKAFATTLIGAFISGWLARRHGWLAGLLMSTIENAVTIYMFRLMLGGASGVLGVPAHRTQEMAIIFIASMSVGSLGGWAGLKAREHFFRPRNSES